MINCDKLIIAAYVLTMDADYTVYKNGAIAVKDGKILAVNEASRLEAGYKPKEKHILKHCLLMPGLINTHTHAAMSYFRGLADDLPLDSWLKDHIWPAEAKYVNRDFVKKGSELACLEMLKSGITCFNDMYFFPEETAEVALATGIRALIGEPLLDFPTPSSRSPLAALARTDELLKRFGKNDKIKITLNIHSIYSCSTSTLKEALAYNSEGDLLINMHVAETEKEVKDAKTEYGLSPVLYLDSLGFFKHLFLAVHGVWLSRPELELMGGKGVALSHNPISNMKLASGIAPIHDAIHNFKVDIGLGTDGAASNNTLDMFSEMRVCSLTQKVSQMDSSVMPSKLILAMASSRAAKTLGLDQAIGSLTDGEKADLIAIDLDSPHLLPLYDPFSLLINCALPSDVRHVMVDGEFIMKDRQPLFIDEERILAEAKEYKS